MNSQRRKRRQLSIHVAKPRITEEGHAGLVAFNGQAVTLPSYSSEVGDIVLHGNIMSNSFSIRVRDIVAGWSKANVSNHFYRGHPHFLIVVRIDIG